ncbi:UNVERIFIED_CONTAM: E3 ubiquitin-protein ligase ATL41 [Sesamum radiatum]|uniref:E3 ubiquitin-protein ligase ATL41 n=1 Tax=Sesamum radiatum TaxID=300843 RepID=A0AAW2KF43_SESRA
MGFTLYTITLPKSSPLKALQDYIFTNLLKLFFTFHNKYAHATTTAHHNHPISSPDHDHQFHPSPSLVPLPLHLISKSIKDHLPIQQYFMLKSKLQATDDEEDGDVDARCAVCLSSIEGWHKVRELGNCVHAFHVECLDAWADQGQETCPVCRAKLLARHAHGELRAGNEDPWRSERMVYLFGEDCLLSELD